MWMDCKKLWAGDIDATEYQGCTDVSLVPMYPVSAIQSVQ